ncbi:FAD-binding protein [Actinosynnema sp. NPDC059797]
MLDPRPLRFDPVHHHLTGHDDCDGTPLPVLDGLVTTTGAALAWATDDFGRTTAHPPPLGVVRPASVEDIGAILGFAREQGIPVVPRAEGHSTAGQAQAPGGIVLDMRGFTAVHQLSEDRVVVDAGVRWCDVLDTALSKGSAPPVLTDHLGTSVGGTLSVGGIGGATHHFGLQTDNVLQLDVVTPDGACVTCSPSVNVELFDDVRAGSGRRGVIVRATVRLVPAHTHARRFRLRYDDLGAFLADQRTLVTEGRFHHLEGRAEPVDRGWAYWMDGVSYFTPPTTPAEEYLLAGLSDVRDAAEVVDLAYRDFQHRLAGDATLSNSPDPLRHHHPWLTLLLPDHAAEHLVAEVFSGLTARDVGDAGRVLLYPVPRARINTPRFRLPDGPIAFLFGLLRAAPPNDPALLCRMLADNRELRDRAVRAGATTYLGAVEG